jgi:hypothetical protein
MERPEEVEGIKIIHLNNIAGVAGDLRDYQREKGDEALLLAHRRYSMQEPDYPLVLDGFVGFNLELLFHSPLLKSADIIHVHGGIRRSQLMLRTLKKKSKARWILHYHGSESRMGYGMHHRDLADAKVISTPDLIRWHPDAVWLPNPISEVLEASVKTRTKRSDMLRIGHFPTKRSIKGTESIQRALAPLIQRREVELTIAEKRPHEEIMSIMRKVDVVIDQLNDLMIFSKVALEAMAIGVPAISSYDASIFPKDCPVWRANSEDELRDRVLEILERGIDDGLRERCMEYVSRYHDPRRVVQKLSEIYAGDLG